MMMKITCTTLVARLCDFKMGRAGKMILNVYIKLFTTCPSSCLSANPSKDLITEEVVVEVQCTLQVEAASNRGD